MTTRKPSDEIIEAVRRSRAAQGLPPTITDPHVLNQVAAVMRLVAKAPPLPADVVPLLRESGFASVTERERLLAEEIAIETEMQTQQGEAK